MPRASCRTGWPLALAIGALVACGAGSARAAIIAQAPSAAPENSEGAAPSGLAPGDASRGMAKFSGSSPLSHGGAPCAACHSVATLGGLGGGAMGPDLTDVFKTYQAPGLAAMLETLPFPTMTPIFSAHPLTPQEQADLRAFLERAGTSEPPAGALGRLIALAILVGVVLASLQAFTWRRRLRGVRKPLVARVQTTR